MAQKKTIPIEKLEEARAQAERIFGRRENFTGADYGPRWKDGKPTGEVVVRVHVRRKLPASALERDEMLPKTINGIQLDVIEGDYRTNDYEAGLSRGHRMTLPFLIGGSSCGRPFEGTGTLGMMVQDRDTKWPGILSNWHVLAGARARLGDVIQHPGAADVQAPDLGAPVARLERWMLNRGGDAAVARIDPNQPWVPLQFGSRAEIRSIRRVELGEVLTKSGRTTGVTSALVDGIGVYRVTYEVAPGRFEPRDIEGFKLVAEERDNPGNTEVSASGDSGASWCNPDTGEGVGLHFASETNPDPRAEHAIACHLDVVMDALNLEPLTFEDLKPPTATAQTAVATEPELSITPDTPIGPWWPWWPWGPNGPRPPIGWPHPGPYPWPLPVPQPGRRPIWDYIQAGGEIPWPLIYSSGFGAPGMRNFGQMDVTADASDLASYVNAMRQVESAGIGGSNGGPRLARPDRLLVIFAHVKAALEAHLGVPLAITINSKISDLIIPDAKAEPMAAYFAIPAALARYVPLRTIWGPGHGLNRLIALWEIQGCETFLELCQVLDSAIEGQ